MHKPIDLISFPPDREVKLKNIYRYSFFEVSYYRSNVWFHNYRVLWLLEEIIPLAQKYLTFDIEKARIYALVHDDAEMVTGDVQAITKARMSSKELQKLEEEELQAIDELLKKYPKTIHGYSYKDLLTHAAKKDCIEAQLVSYLNKLDALCESLHELLAGNDSYLRSVMFYVNTLTLFPYKYPDLKVLLDRKDSPLTYLNDRVSPYEIKKERYSHLHKPHTIETIKIETDFPFYNTWRKLIIENGKQEGLDYLLIQKEH